MQKNSILIALLFLAAACTGKQPGGKTDQASAGLVQLQYAEGFSIAHKARYTTVTVYNPWKPGEVYDKYYLVRDEAITVPDDGHRVAIPIKSLMSNSATHLGFLDLLGETDKVTGVSGASYIYNPTILEGLKTGKITDVGDAFNLDIERLLLLHPQVVMTSAYNAEDANSKHLRRTGITVLYNIEWQEKTLLGRAEWIKFIAAFFDKEALAAKIFDDVAHHYNMVKDRVEDALPPDSLPTVLSGQDFRGTWSMPGGKSFNARLFRDAGMQYRYADDTRSGSIESTIEEALLYFADADVWVGAQTQTLKELEATNSKYRLFKAFRNGNVYNNLNKANASGGNDYWESGPARPDLLLSDMIKISWPRLLPEYELTYMKRLAR